MSAIVQHNSLSMDPDLHLKAHLIQVRSFKTLFYSNKKKRNEPSSKRVLRDVWRYGVHPYVVLQDGFIARGFAQWSQDCGKLHDVMLRTGSWAVPAV